MRSRMLAIAAAVTCGFGLAACSGDDSAEDEAPEVSAVPINSTTAPISAGGTSSTVAPQPEQSVPALATDEADITVGGYIFEIDGTYLLCEAASDADPPECEGESIEISNGDVIDPSIFLGEPGAQYSDAEVVVTGDVVDGVLTIG